MQAMDFGSLCQALENTLSVDKTQRDNATTFLEQVSTRFYPAP